jgi:hypothetical protein
MSFQVPKYRLHKGSGQALVQVGGRRVYLGKYGSARSKEKYRRLVAEALTRKDLPAAVRSNLPGGGLSAKAVILAYDQARLGSRHSRRRPY